ncbi:NAD(P)-dependent oxidoreductase [Lapidilactobacillus luobeiensis]|uniref:NAD(P)-dependent oxidoreductase n=1 Tax=Lapidilactobacillus luobeiensis TaxID=2950371 RepID=UPI0021C45118|nr:NAD(P)-dependent oxidoreductase [Lapidilactobacillus luobeiensis]
MEKIGFIGTGVMGTGIIKNLLGAGYSVAVYNRTQAHADAVIAAGATWVADPARLTEQVDVVMTMVGFPEDVTAVYFGEQGILSAVRPGQVLIDLTTSKPALAKEIAQAAAKKQAIALDAPVSGGDIGAAKGTLTVMVGGPESTYQAMRPLFQAMGQQINRFGAAGQGQATKMANQIMVAGTMTGLTEMLVYAKAAGLDLALVLRTVGGGAAANWSLTNYGPRILAGDYTPGFFAKHFLKDLRIALDEAQALGIELPATAQAAKLYQLLVERDKHGEDGTQALVKLWWPTAQD